MKFEDKILTFRSLFPDEESCLELLADFKWENGYACTKCGNTNYCGGKTKFSRRCTRCKKDESATANTAFHRCKIPLNKAFEIAFLICNMPAISSYEISRQIEVRHMTCYTFQKKIINCRNEETKDKLLEKVLEELNTRVDLEMKAKKRHRLSPVS
jgi:two-component system, sensor histidine kinase LadS